MNEKQNHFRTQHYAEQRRDRQLVVIALLRLHIQQHHHEEIQHQDRTGIHDDLDSGQKFRMQSDVEACDMKKHDQQGKRAVDGISQCHDQERGDCDHTGEIEEKNVVHVSVEYPKSGPPLLLPAVLRIVR